MPGCVGRTATNRGQSPASVGYNTNNLIDAETQAWSEWRIDAAEICRVAEKIRRENMPAVMPPKRSVLCLSGGGAYGAYSVGVLCGWTMRGDRPRFDVVTGISTGALTAPFAFLGPHYDAQLAKLFTTLKKSDIFTYRPVRGLVSESRADNSPLADEIDAVLTQEMLREIVVEHCRGRRLYIGTTEAEGRQFIVWDIGAIACRGSAQDRELIKQILLGSTAVPGFFPPAKIRVTINGQSFVEQHVDGGVSQSLFFQPPPVPPERINLPDARSLYGTDVYVVVAGKLYADPGEMKPTARAITADNVSTLAYAQTRGDLTRLWAACAFSGMNFNMTAIPPEFPAPQKSTAFESDAMTAMFDEGVRQVMAGIAWRTTPPGVGAGESVLVRSGTNLTYQPRSPDRALGESNR